MGCQFKQPFTNLQTNVLKLLVLLYVIMHFVPRFHRHCFEKPNLFEIVALFDIQKHRSTRCLSDQRQETKVTTKCQPKSNQIERMACKWQPIQAKGEFEWPRPQPISLCVRAKLNIYLSKKVLVVDNGCVEVDALAYC